MTATIESIYALEGPNTFIAQPAVLIYLRADEQFSFWFVARLKEVAQRVGIVIAFLKVHVEALPDDWRIKVEFATPQPTVACAIAELLMQEYKATQAHDESWDSEEEIYQLQRKTRRERIPLPIVQLQASCMQHNLPLLRLADGRWQIGLGKNSLQFEQAEVLQNLPFQPNWHELSAIPIAAWVGGRARALTLARLQALFAQSEPRMQVVDQLNHTLARQIFADQALEHALFGLEVDTIFCHGLPFGQCHYAALLDLPDPPPSCIDPEKWLWSSVLPLVLAEGSNVLSVVNADDARTVGVAEFAASECVYISTGSDYGATVMAAHRAKGGRALFLRGQAVYHAQGEQEEYLGDLAIEDSGEQLGLLAIYLYLDHAGFTELKAALPWA